jgi:hypothetical protein
MRFIRDEPIVDRECAIADVEDLTQYHNATPANPNMTDYEFDEVYHQDPVTGCGQYMLNRNDKYLDKKFGLGLLVYVALLSATLLALVSAAELMSVSDHRHHHHRSSWLRAISHESGLLRAGGEEDVRSGPTVGGWSTT